MIESIIRQRRTIKPAQMNGKVIPDEMIHHLLELADWAPTHGRTEPWRFIVYSGDKMVQFCQEHSQLYKDNTPPENFKEVSFGNLLHASEGASHLIIAYMKRGNNPNIPEIEEIAATAAAIQNLLLGISAHGYGAFWSTSGLVHRDEFKDHLKLDQHDKVLGILYLDLSDDPLKAGKRVVPMSEKVTWIS